MKGERLIPFPFQGKQIGSGADLPVMDRVMEESKTLDKWQMAAGAAAGIASLAFPPLAPFAAATIGGSLVSHEVTRGELRRRQGNRQQQQAQELQKAA